MTLTITPVYAGLVGLMLVALSFRVIFRRRSAKVSLGDGDDTELRKCIRVQANCAEYAPFALLLMLLVELEGGSPLFVHAIGITLLLGRLMHGYGFSASPPIMPLRTYGMLLTFTSLALSIAGLRVLSVMSA